MHVLAKCSGVCMQSVPVSTCKACHNRVGQSWFDTSYKCVVQIQVKLAWMVRFGKAMKILAHGLSLDRANGVTKRFV